MDRHDQRETDRWALEAAARRDVDLGTGEYEYDALLRGQRFDLRDNTDGDPLHDRQVYLSSRTDRTAAAATAGFWSWDLIRILDTASDATQEKFAALYDRAHDQYVAEVEGEGVDEYGIDPVDVDDRGQS